MIHDEPAGGRLYRFSASPLCITLISLLVLFLLTLPFGMGIDEGLWNYIGNLWARYGIPPYIGAVENKPPGIFELFTISNLLFGVNYWFPRSLGILSTALTAALLCCLGRLHGRIAGAFAGAIFLLIITWGRVEGPYLAQVESFMNMFIVLGFFFIIGTRNSRPLLHAFLAGLSAGFAIQFKQVAVLSACAMLIIIMADRRTGSALGRLLTASFFLVGAGLGILLLLIPLLCSGVGLWDYLDGAWLILFQKGTAAPLAYRLVNFYRIWLRSEMVLLWPLVLVFFAYGKRLSKEGIPVMGLIIWMLFDFIGANASGYYYGHQLRQFVPSVALAGGLAIAQIFRTLQGSNIINPKRIPVYVIASLSVLALVFCVFSPFRIRPEYQETPRALGLWLKENTTRDEYVYVNTLWDGGSTVLAYSERRCPSRYFTYMLLSRQGAMEEFTKDMHEHKPKFIVDWPDDPWMRISWVQGFLDSNYVLVRTEGCFRVYQLK